MKFRITPTIPETLHGEFLKRDGSISDTYVTLAQAPPVEVDVAIEEEYGKQYYSSKDWDKLFSVIDEEMCNDEGWPFGVGFTLTIERIA